MRRAPDPDDRRKVIVELVADPGGLDEALAPARQKVGAIVQGYSPEQQAVLFDYFARAADAYVAATAEVHDKRTD